MHEISIHSCVNVIFMKTTQISQGGQISIPAQVRRRWQTRRVTVEDRGDEVVVRPIPDDPIATAIGVFSGHITATSDELRARLREEEAEIERRKYPELDVS